MNNRHVIALIAVVGLGLVGASCGDDGPGSPSSSSPSAAPTTEIPESTPAPVPSAVETSPADSVGTTPATSAVETTPAGSVGATEPGSTIDGDRPTEAIASDLLVGLTEDDAEAAATDAGWRWRVARRDGENLALTMDFRPDRVNVEITDGSVTAVVSIG